MTALGEHPMGGAQRASRRWRLLAAAIAGGVALTVFAVWVLVGDGPRGVARQGSGPLKFPGHFGSILSPQEGERVFVTLPGCLDDRTADATITSLKPVSTTGPADVEFAIAWESNKAGSGRASRLPKQFRTFDDQPVTGSVPACNEPTEAAFEIAVVFGPAVEQDVLVQDIRVAYSIGGRAFERTASILFGVCAPKHPDPVEECSEVR